MDSEELVHLRMQPNRDPLLAFDHGVAAQARKPGYKLKAKSSSHQSYFETRGAYLTLQRIPRERAVEDNERMDSPRVECIADDGLVEVLHPQGGRVLRALEEAGVRLLLDAVGVGGEYVTSDEGRRVRLRIRAHLPVRKMRARPGR